MYWLFDRVVSAAGARAKRRKFGGISNIIVLFMSSLFFRYRVEVLVREY